METANKKVCANCAAFDQIDSTCHRYPPEFGRKAFPETKSTLWCLMHQDIVDESGWRKEWPSRDSIISRLLTESCGMNCEELAPHFAQCPMPDLAKALARLKFEGVIYWRASRFVAFRKSTAAQLGPAIVPPPRPRPKSARELILEAVPIGESERWDRSDLRKKMFYEHHMAESSFDFAFRGLCQFGAIKKHADGRVFK